jgi:hypothetical protein
MMFAAASRNVQRSKLIGFNCQKISAWQSKMPVLKASYVDP